MADEKKYLRAILRETRESLTPGIAGALSARVQAIFLHSDFYRESRSVVLYSALANEVSTDAILSDALATPSSDALTARSSDAPAAGRAIFYPRLDRARNALSLCKVESRSDLAPRAYGILEPETPAIDVLSMPPSVVVVPGVAFTKRGERMGRGGGHYDRLLAELSELAPHAITVGLAYSFQLLDDIPQSGWDRRLNFVVTESAIYPASDAIRRESGIRAQGGNPR